MIDPLATSPLPFYAQVHPDTADSFIRPLVNAGGAGAVILVVWLFIQQQNALAKARHESDTARDNLILTRLAEIDDRNSELRSAAMGRADKIFDHLASLCAE